MKKIEFNKAVRFSPNGLDAISCKKGDKLDVLDDKADLAVKNGYANFVGVKINLPDPEPKQKVEAKPVEEVEEEKKVEKKAKKKSKIASAITKTIKGAPKNK